MQFKPAQFNSIQATLSGILFEIYYDIPSAVLFVIYFTISSGTCYIDILFRILSDIPPLHLAFGLTFYLISLMSYDIPSAILSDIYFDILSSILSGILFGTHFGIFSKTYFASYLAFLVTYVRATCGSQ
jgi:hypothetical protein